MMVDMPLDKEIKPNHFGGWGVSVMANVLDYNIIVSKFELQLCCYIHFRSVCGVMDTIVRNGHGNMS